MFCHCKDFLFFLNFVSKYVHLLNFCAIKIQAIIALLIVFCLVERQAPNPSLLMLLRALGAFDFSLSFPQSHWFDVLFSLCSLGRVSMKDHTYLTIFQTLIRSKNGTATLSIFNQELGFFCNKGP